MKPLRPLLVAMTALAFCFAIWLRMRSLPASARGPAIMTEAQARLELEACGFLLVENRQILPCEHFPVFVKP